MRGLILGLLMVALMVALGLNARAESIATGQQTLSTSAALVSGGSSSRGTVLVRNLDASISIYVGSAGVTSSTGMLIKAGESITIRTSGALYAVAASGTPAVAVLEEFGRSQP